MTNNKNKSNKKKNGIKYFSTDKMYELKNDVIKNHPKAVCILLFSISCIFLILSALLFVNSYSFNNKVEKAKYDVVGATDYTVYLKENNYYDDKFLPSGMQYVASL